MPKEENTKEIFEAARAGNLIYFKNRLYNYKTFNVWDEGGETLLEYLIRYFQYDIANYILHNGADPLMCKSNVYISMLTNEPSHKLTRKLSTMCIITENEFPRSIAYAINENLDDLGFVNSDLLNKFATVDNYGNDIWIYLARFLGNDDFVEIFDKFNRHFVIRNNYNNYNVINILVKNRNTHAIKKIKELMMLMSFCTLNDILNNIGKTPYFMDSENSYGENLYYNSLACSVLMREFEIFKILIDLGADPTIKLKSINTENYISVREYLDKNKNYLGNYLEYLESKSKSKEESKNQGQDQNQESCLMDTILSKVKEELKMDELNSETKEKIMNLIKKENLKL